jgi:FkbM family methyltransferase
MVPAESLKAWQRARAFSQFWRFNTMRTVSRLREQTPGPCIVHRPFAGHELYVDLSRYDSQGLLYFEGERFVTERSLIARLVKPGMRIVDCGANLGYYMLLFEKLAGPTSVIDAIEPSRANLTELRLNIERNQLKNVRLHEVALGAAAGEAWLAESINSHVLAASEDQSLRAYRVPVQPLDELITGRVDLLKIDVDGFEGFVLEGARRLLARDRPVVFLEFHPLLVKPYGHSFASIHAELSRVYSSISYYDVPQPMPVARKVLEHYFGADGYRQLPGPPAEPMEQGRAEGTFWIVCR